MNFIIYRQSQLGGGHVCCVYKGGAASAPSKYAPGGIARFRSLQLKLYDMQGGP